jgi:hypothetical protein
MTPSPGRFRRFRDLWRARRDGRRDGRRGIPTSHETSHPPALVQIAQRAHEALAELAKNIATDEVTRHAQLDAVERQRGDAEFDVDVASQAIAAHDKRRDQATPSRRRPPRTEARGSAVASTWPRSARS